VISITLGLLFTVVYTSVIVVDFLGLQDHVNILALFVGVACVAGGAACYQTRRWRQGLSAAIWALVIGTAAWSVAVQVIYYVTCGSHAQYVFWLNDGAVGDFQRSGSTDFAVFVLQDIQGALFFHPILSVVVGLLGGLAGSTVVRGLMVRRRA
jgi:hypothetical protein